MKDLFLLLKAELRMMLNSIKATPGKNKGMSKIIGFVFIAVIFYFLSIGSKSLFNGMANMFGEFPDIVNMIQANLLSSFTLGLYIIMFMMGFSSIFSMLFDSGDMNFLMSTPIKPLAVFSSKLIKCIWSNISSVGIFGIAVWLGFGLSKNASFSFYLVAIITLLLQVVAFTALMALIVLLISRITGSSRLRNIMKIVFLMLGLVLVIVIQIVNSSLASSENNPLAAIGNSFSGSGILSSPSIMPHVLSTKANLSVLGGYNISFLSSFLPLLLIVFAITFICFIAANKMFLGGWTISKEVDNNKRKVKIASDKKSVFHLFNNQSWGLFYKDIKIWIRQPFLWYGIAVSLVGIFFIQYNFRNMSNIHEADTILKYVILGMTIMMASLSSGSLSIFSVSMDGESIWFLRTAPINVSSYYLSKLGINMMPSLIVGLIGTIGGAQFGAIEHLPYYISIPALLLALTAIQAIQLYSDISKPNFNLNLSGTGWNKRMNDPVKSLVLTFSSMIGALVVTGILAFNSYGGYIGFLKNVSNSFLIAISIGAFLVLVLTIIILMYKASIRKLKNMFVSH